MPDNVALLVDGKRIENFLAYRIEADIYTCDDAFSLELANPEIRIREGMDCKVQVNDQEELHGIIDRVKESYGKEGRKLTVEGRDLAGILVDSHITDYTDTQSMTLKELADKLLRKAPFIQRNEITYQVKSVLSLENVKIDPGSTIFEVLKEYAFSRGLIFWVEPDGKFVFGKPKERPDGEVLYKLVCKKDGTMNNILEGEKILDISKSFSEVTIMGQKQGNDMMLDFNDVNSKATATNPDFPAGFYKPYVTHRDSDHLSPHGWAKLLVDQMRFQQLQLSYKVAGHSFEGKNWKINEFCHVEDEVFEISADYLVYGRIFEMSKESGKLTTLKVGLPGVLQ